MKLKPINAVQTSEEKKSSAPDSGALQSKNVDRLSQDQRQEDLPWCHFDRHNSRIAELTVQKHS